MNASFEPFLELMGIEPRDRILELECGDGQMSALLASRVPAGMVVGMDPSDELVYRARARARDLDNVMFMPGGAGGIPWKEDFFSKVLSHGSPQELRDILRVLAPGGILYLEIEPAGAEQWAEKLGAAGFSPVQTHGLAEHAVLAAQKPG